VSIDDARTLLDSYQRGQVPLEEAATRLATLACDDGWGFHIDIAQCPPERLASLQVLEHRVQELLALRRVRNGSAGESGTA
jgi:hypothetical protein